MKLTKLDYSGSYNTVTGEIESVNQSGKVVSNYYEAYFNNMHYKVYDSGLIIVEGSLHKYAKVHGHNHDDFSLWNARYTMKEFLLNIKVGHDEARINHFEVGVNVVLPFSVDYLIRNTFLHKTRAFERCNTKSEGVYYQTEHDQYRVKQYNKHKESRNIIGVPKDLYRFEVNLQSNKLNSTLGFRNVKGFLNADNDLFINCLDRTYRNLFVFDKNVNLSSERIMKYSNPLFWQDMILEKRLSAFYKHKTIYEKANEELKNSMSSQVLKLINEKSIELIGGC